MEPFSSSSSVVEGGLLLARARLGLGLELLAHVHSADLDLDRDLRLVHKQLAQPLDLKARGGQRGLVADLEDERLLAAEQHLALQADLDRGGNLERLAQVRLEAAPILGRDDGVHSQLRWA